MKKIIILLLPILFLLGCENTLNTPTSKVESFFKKYQTLDKNVLLDLDNYIDKNNKLTKKQKEEYKEVLKKQYQNLSYKIKEETIDGKNATVEAEIEVYNYKKILDEVNDYYNEHQEEFMNDETKSTDTLKYNDYKLEKLKNANDKVTYTLNLTLKKVDDKWVLDDLTDTEISKIHGMYDYE